MSEMIERVAYAIALYEMRAKTPTLAAFCESIPEARAAAVAQAVETYGGTARAAIEAMRKPTDRMVAHGAGYTDFYLPEAIGSGVDDYKREIGIAWVAMIDAALKEAP